MLGWRRRWIIYTSIYRVPECLIPSSELVPPASSPASECVPPGSQRGAHSPAGEGAGESIRTTGEKAWHSVYSAVGGLPFSFVFGLF